MRSACDEFPLRDEAFRALRQLLDQARAPMLDPAPMRHTIDEIVAFGGICDELEELLPAVTGEPDELFPPVGEGVVRIVIESAAMLDVETVPPGRPLAPEQRQQA